MSWEPWKYMQLFPYPLAQSLLSSYRLATPQSWRPQHPNSVLFSTITAVIFLAILTAARMSHPGNPGRSVLGLLSPSAFLSPTAATAARVTPVNTASVISHCK